MAEHQLDGDVTAWVWIGCTTKIRAESRDIVPIEESSSRICRELF